MNVLVPFVVPSSFAFFVFIRDSFYFLIGLFGDIPTDIYHHLKKSERYAYQNQENLTLPWDV